MTLAAIALSLIAASTAAQAAPSPSAISPASSVPAAAVGGFTVGVDTLETIEAKLGKPSSLIRSSDGTSIAIYSRAHTRIKGTSFIPLIGLFAGGAKSSASTTIYTFGHDGVLTNVTISDTTVDCHATVGGAHCR